MAAEMVINDELTGQHIDPEGVQEESDNQLYDIEASEEFAHLDPEEYNAPPEGTFPMAFKAIQVRPLAQICEDARRLDFNQRVVLAQAVRYARQLRMAQSGKGPIPDKAPLIMVDGSAGQTWKMSNLLHGPISTNHILHIRDIFQLCTGTSLLCLIFGNFR